MTLTVTEIVADARSQIREVGAGSFDPGADGCILIDVREPAELETGHIAGAINIPRGVLEFQVDAHPAVANVSDPALSHKDRLVVLVCRTGGRAALAALNLQRMGFSDVRSIEGGILAWTACGRTLTMH